MKIRMLEERTGPRHDGRAWPPVGGEIEVSDEEGAGVCAAGWATPVAEQRQAESGEAKRARTEETRTAAAKPRVPKQG